MPYLGLAVLIIMVVALIDIINTDDSRVLRMPKFGWIVLVIFLPLIGSVLWLAFGRPTADDPPRYYRGAARDYPEYDRPGRYVAQDPEADRAFLEQLRARAEEQRRIAREQERQKRADEPEG